MKKEYIILTIFVFLLLAAGIWIFHITRDYREAEKEYEELQEYIEENPKEEKEVSEEEDEIKENRVDFAGLKRINPDIVAWLRIPGVLDYPVVQGKDNQYYLSHTFQKNYNIAGSIFLDYRNSSDFTDSKNIIYGHNMKDGSMFHVLRNFQKIDFYQKNREILLYLPDGSVQSYKIVACEEVRAAGEVYELGGENKEEKELILSTCSSRSELRVIVKGNI